MNTQYHHTSGAIKNCFTVVPTVLLFDECASSECINGTCVDEVGGYFCNCTEGFNGTYCDFGKC